MLSLYWPYPSPPVSPSVFPQPGLLLLRGLAPSTTLADILGFFHGYSEIGLDSIAMLGGGNGGVFGGEALISFRNALDAERALLERSGHLLAGAPVQLVLVSL